jgi:host factor-I protein
VGQKRREKPMSESCADFFSFLNNESLDQVTLEDLNAFVDSLADQGLSIRTQRRIVTWCSHFGPNSLPFSLHLAYIVDNGGKIMTNQTFEKETSKKGTKQQQINVQDKILNNLRTLKKQVKIFTINGFQMTGTIEMFDNFTILLINEMGKQQLLYKHAISTIQLG